MTAVSAHSPYNPPPEPGRPETARRYEGELGFWDMVDVVNPLQHLPVVNWVYRGVTGDTIQPPARIAGAALYGGPVGMVGAIADEALAEHSGRHAHEHALALVTGDPGPSPSTEVGPTVAEGPLPEGTAAEGAAAGATPGAPAPAGQLGVAEGPLPAGSAAGTTTVAEAASASAARSPSGQIQVAEGPLPGTPPPRLPEVDSTVVASASGAAIGAAATAAAPMPTAARASAGLAVAEGPAVGGLAVAEGPVVGVAPAATPLPGTSGPAAAARPLETASLRFFDLSTAPRYGGTAASAPRPPSGPVVADSRIDAALMALAGQADAAATATAPGVGAPGAGATGALPGATAAGPPGLPGAIPAGGVPEAMAEALARYYEGGAVPAPPSVDTAS